MAYVKNLFRDEIREDVLVKSNKKKFGTVSLKFGRLSTKSVANTPSSTT